MTDIDSPALVAWIDRCAEQIHENRDLLSDLDSSTGDADHGSNLDRGFTAVSQTLPALGGEVPADLLKSTGMTLVDTIGGSSGALYGTLFLRMARSVGPDASTITREDLAEALAAGAEGIAQRGRVSVGDKTMYDALAPAVDALKAALANDATLCGALQQAAQAAERGRDQTADLVARRGRSSYTGERSLGAVDPGSASMAIIIRAAADTLGSDMVTR